MTDAFDALAADYDQTFTHSVVGRAQRSAITRRLAARFAAGDRVLEIGCGTGEDALALVRRGVSVAATDPSAAMLEVARAKAQAAGLADRLTLRRLAAEALDTLPHDARYDGAFSSFGALNCAPDLRPVAQELGRLVRPGGWVVLCLLGRWVPWEWLWFLLRLKPRTAARRLSPSGVTWRTSAVRYPPLRAVRRIFAPSFRLARTSGIGVLVPPSYAEGWAKRHPRLIAALASAEKRLETLPPIARLGDHVLLELERR